MKAAVVIPDGSIINFIVADADVDPAPEGCILVNIVPEDRPINYDYTWDGTQFVPPPGYEAPV
jgi:hypothetical protein